MTHQEQHQQHQQYSAASTTNRASRLRPRQNDMDLPPPPRASGGSGSDHTNDSGSPTSAASTGRTDSMTTPSTRGGAGSSRGHSRNSSGVSDLSGENFRDERDLVPPLSIGVKRGGDRVGAPAAPPPSSSAIGSPSPSVSPSAVTIPFANTAAAARAKSATAATAMPSTPKSAGSSVATPLPSNLSFPPNSNSGVSSITGNTEASSVLVGLVQQQADMVKSLTDANHGTNEQLRKVQEEKRRMEKELEETKKALEQRTRAKEKVREDIERKKRSTNTSTAAAGVAKSRVADFTKASSHWLTSPDPFGIAPGTPAGVRKQQGTEGGLDSQVKEQEKQESLELHKYPSPPPPSSKSHQLHDEKPSSTVAILPDAIQQKDVPPTAGLYNTCSVASAHATTLRMATSASRQRVAFEDFDTVVYPEATAAVATPVDEYNDEYGFKVDGRGRPASLAASGPVSPRTERWRKKKKRALTRKPRGSSRRFRNQISGFSLSSTMTSQRSLGVPLPKPRRTIPMASTDFAPPIKIPPKEPSCSSKFWSRFSKFGTCCIPDKLICRTGAQAKQAWREKVAICLIAVLISAFFVGAFGFIPLFLCAETTVYTWEDIGKKNAGALSLKKYDWTVIHGNIYDMSEFASAHSGGSEEVLKWVGRDASRMFPRTAGKDLPVWCLNATAEPEDLVEYNKAACVDFEAEDEQAGTVCHNQSSALIGPDNIERYLGKYRKGTLAPELTKDTLDFDWIVINKRVYNVTAYTRHIRNPKSGKIAPESPNAFLNAKLTDMIANKIYSDATEVFAGMYKPEVSEDYLKCFEDMYFAGVVDSSEDPVCDALNIVMYVILILVLTIMMLQFLCSLMYIAKGTKTLTKQMEKSKVMVMVPCYNEGDRELSKTIKSVLDSDYPEDNKVLLVVCDGLITGRGEEMSTPETVAKQLGYEMDLKKDKAHSYRSIGAFTKNKAFVYRGTYTEDDRQLKYVVVVKCGTSKERSSPRAGNRGKRDSQLLLLGALNRIHYHRELCELDVALCRALNDLNLGLDELGYLMAIDADTRIHREAMARMIFDMEREPYILACSGETKVDNKTSSLITMIQVYEYFASHHMKKAFESVFGCVTCLPGCFTMYRIISEDDVPLISNDDVFAQYSRNDIESLHEKNLYHLGEDRMLTTLLLMCFPDMSLSFVPEAKCWTIVPHTFRILLSQRRRWINSTFHNMWELLKVEGLCGVCCFSMKTVVAADMIATMVLPASFLYAVYFVYTVIVQGTAMSETLVVIYAVTIGCQMLVFLLRSRWDYLLWFFMYLIFGVPVFFFILPVYSFWNMDDLSWGQTRQVAAEKGKSPGELISDEPAESDEPPVSGEPSGPSDSDEQGESGGGALAAADPELGGGMTAGKKLGRSETAPATDDSNPDDDNVHVLTTMAAV